MSEASAWYSDGDRLSRRSGLGARPLPTEGEFPTIDPEVLARLDAESPLGFDEGLGSVASLKAKARRERVEGEIEAERRQGEGEATGTVVVFPAEAAALGGLEGLVDTDS
ncbi:MAG TPA: hypothetical protein VG964_01470 [Candidatus Saccharimonadales bacterium]|nr:hypothetical protein [Candidatus Saccharimonadales bacterium]